MQYTKGPRHVLEEIDPETLPEEDVWSEVARRFEAWQDGRAGWRTGDIEATLDEAEERRCRS